MGTKSAVTSAYVTRPKRSNRFAIRKKKSYELHPTYWVFFCNHRRVLVFGSSRLVVLVCTYSLKTYVLSSYSIVWFAVHITVEINFFQNEVRQTARSPKCGRRLHIFGRRSCYRQRIFAIRSIYRTVTGKLIDYRNFLVVIGVSTATIQSKNLCYCSSDTSRSIR